MAAIARTPVGHMLVGSRLCQRFKALAGGGFDVTMPDQLRGIELDANLAGELREKVEVAAEFEDLREAGIDPAGCVPAPDRDREGREAGR